MTVGKSDSLYRSERTSFLGKTSSSVRRGVVWKSTAYRNGSDHTLLGKLELAGRLGDSRVEWMEFQQVRKEGEGNKGSLRV